MFHLPLVLPILPFLYDYGGYGGYHERGVSDAAADFRRITGLEWPESAKVIDADDTHLQGEDGFGFGPGVLDGEFYLIFDADPETLKEWLTKDAPWDAEWKRGPIPPEKVCAGFGDSRGYGSVDGGPRKYHGNEHFMTLIESATIWYAAHARGSGGTSWHDGELIAIDVGRGRVWVAKWDN